MLGNRTYLKRSGASRFGNKQDHPAENKPEIYPDLAHHKGAALGLVFAVDSTTGWEIEQFIWKTGSPSTSDRKLSAGGERLNRRRYLLCLVWETYLAFSRCSWLGSRGKKYMGS